MARLDDVDRMRVEIVEAEVPEHIAEMVLGLTDEVETLRALLEEWLGVGYTPNGDLETRTGVALGTLPR